MYKANLSFSLAQEYTSFLVARGHLQIVIDVHGVHRYVLTAKGQRLLGLLVEVERELEGFFPESPVIYPSPVRPSIKELMSDLDKVLSMS